MRHVISFLVMLLMSSCGTQKQTSQLFEPQSSVCICNVVDKDNTAAVIDQIASSIVPRDSQYLLREFIDYFKEIDSAKLSKLNMLFRGRVDARYKHTGCVHNGRKLVPSELMKLDSCRLELYSYLTDLPAESVYPIFSEAISKKDFNLLDSITRVSEVSFSLSLDPELSNGYRSCLRLTGGRIFNDTCGISSTNW